MLMTVIPAKDMGEHPNSSITLPISSEMMTEAASLARLVAADCHHLCCVCERERG